MTIGYSKFYKMNERQGKDGSLKEATGAGREAKGKRSARNFKDEAVVFTGQIFLMKLIIISDTNIYPFS